MENILTALGTFILVYLVYLFLIVLRKKKVKKYQNSTEVKFLVNRYNINIKKINLKKLANLLALTNSFIIAVTILAVSYINGFILKLMVGFIVLFPMILIFYSIIGKQLSKKYGK